MFDILSIMKIQRGCGDMMTVQEMREQKRKYGYTYKQLSQLSGVPVGTIQKIFRGETSSPRYENFRALEQAFRSGQNPDELRENVVYGRRICRKYMVKVIWWDNIFCEIEK